MENLETKKIVLLDLGGVVLGMRGESTKEIDWDVITDLNKKYMSRMNVGDEKLSTFLEEYNARTNQSLSQEEFLKRIHDTITFNQELVDYLRKHFTIVITSDNFKENIKYLSERHEFSSWTSEEFYSYDFGVQKTNPQFFRKVLESLGEKPENCILIDDDPNNVKIAKSLGIEGITHKDNNQTIDKIGLMQ